MPDKSTRDDAYDAGYDCGIHGPNPQNCHFRHFAKATMTALWELGKRDGERDKLRPPEPSDA